MTRCIVQVPVVYANDEQFQIGKAKILRQAEGDQVSCQQSLFVQLDCCCSFASFFSLQVLIVAAGITLFEALKAADTLAAAGVKVFV